MVGEEMVRLRLQGSAELASLVGVAIFAGKAPQNQPAPYVVWRRVSGFRSHTLSGPSDLKEGRFQIDCYALTYDAMLAIAQAVEPAIASQNDGDMCAELEMEIDQFEEGPPQLWRRILDFMVTERNDDGG